jgi:hypothetical protein
MWAMPFAVETLTNQSGEIRFQPRSVFRRVLEQCLDEATLSQAKVPANPAVRQPVQPGYRLLSEGFFKLVSGHGNSSSTPRRKALIARLAVSARPGWLSYN